VETNVESLTWLFECIVEGKLPIKKIVAASSQSVYGEGHFLCATHGETYCRPRSEAQLAAHRWEQMCPTCGTEMRPLPEHETDEPRPEIPYGSSKLAGEWLLKNFTDYAHIPTVSLRFSIVLGPRQSVKHFYSGALRAFAVYALRGEPMRMNEDGWQLRDFVDVRDVASAHRMVLEDPRADGRTFNIGSGTGTRVIDLARLVAEEASVPFQPSLTNRFRIGGARHSLMDVSAMRSLGWSLAHPLRDSVSAYLAYLKTVPDPGDALEKNEESMKRSGLLKDL
jgi:dTDP-L-rhamnose 4-epimerase